MKVRLTIRKYDSSSYILRTNKTFRIKSLDCRKFRNAIKLERKYNDVIKELGYLGKRCEIEKRSAGVL